MPRAFDSALTRAVKSLMEFSHSTASHLDERMIDTDVCQAPRQGKGCDWNCELYSPNGFAMTTRAVEMRDTSIAVRDELLSLQMTSSEAKSRVKKWRSFARKL